MLAVPKRVSGTHKQEVNLVAPRLLLKILLMAPHKLQKLLGPSDLVLPAHLALTF